MKIFPVLNMLLVKRFQITRRFVTTVKGRQDAKFRETASTSDVPEMPPCSFVPESYQGYDYEKVVQVRQSSLSPALLTYYKKPVLIHQGHQQWLFDHTGKRYLDLFAGIVTVSVGHCHPKVNKALLDQTNKLWHTTNIYMHPKIHEYAEKLVAKLPDNLKIVHFVNSGSEANDMAMYMARLYTGNYDIISFRNAYHGMSPYTMGLTAHSNWKYKVPAGFGIHHAMNPDVYRGLWGGKHCRDSPVQTEHQCDCAPTECKACDKYLDQLEEVLKYSLPEGGCIAGFFTESIQGVGGTVQYPKNYLKKAFELVRASGGICISDEVQTGFGRTGEHYWGFEMHDIVPDIVTMAKGIGNGFPLAAIVTTPEISKVMAQALHFNTYGGNPLASAVGIAVLDAIEEDHTQQNSHELGTYFLLQLAKLRDEFDVVGDVRGKGLMIGVEMVTDKKSKTPMPGPDILEIWEACKDMGVLLGKGGLYGHVFRIKPPMCLTKEDVNFSIAVMRVALAAFTEKRK